MSLLLIPSDKQAIPYRAFNFTWITANSLPGDIKLIFLFEFRTFEYLSKLLPISENVLVAESVTICF